MFDSKEVIGLFIRLRVRESNRGGGRSAKGELGSKCLRIFDRQIFTVIQEVGGDINFELKHNSCGDCFSGGCPSH